MTVAFKWPAGSAGQPSPAGTFLSTINTRGDSSREVRGVRWGSTLDCLREAARSEEIETTLMLLRKRRAVGQDDRRRRELVGPEQHQGAPAGQLVGVDEHLVAPAQSLGQHLPVQAELDQERL